jgi:hypothetical protein
MLQRAREASDRNEEPKHRERTGEAGYARATVGSAFDVVDASDERGLSVRDNRVIVAMLLACWSLAGRKRK